MASPSKSTPTENVVRPPEGFQRQGSSSGAPWAKIEVGTVVSGKLLGKFKRPDPKSPTKESFFFQVEVNEKTKCTSGKGTDAKVISADPGSVVNLNYTKKTGEAYDPFIPQVLAGAVVEIWTHVKAKLSTSTGNTFWDMDCFAKLVSPATPEESSSPSDFTDEE